MQAPKSDDWTGWENPPRSETEIREDLRKQLEDIHRRYLAKWVHRCP